MWHRKQKNQESVLKESINLCQQQPYSGKG